MANITKQKRDQMLEYIQQLKLLHNDDNSLKALNELENHLSEKKFGLVFEEHTENAEEKMSDFIPVFCEDSERFICNNKLFDNYNFIIEGDNLHALHLLEKTHKGKIDCIYIDPPYNTGAKDWKYNNDYVDVNDNYRHSKWLSMMKSRLLYAKKLLNPKDSVLICTIDEKEFLHLGCLLEEIFKNAKIQMISSVINSTSVARSNEFNRNNEYIFFVMIGDYKITPFDESVFSQNNNGAVRWRGFRRTNAANTRDKTKTQFYPIYVEKATSKIVKIGDPLRLEDSLDSVETIEGCVVVYPIKDDGTEMMWGVSVEECKNRLSKGYIRAKNYNPQKPQKYLIEYLLSGTIEDINEGKITIKGYNPDGSAIVENNFTTKVMPKTQWDILSHSAREYGTKILDNIFHDKRFPFPKSLYAVHDSLRYFVFDKPNAIILDFFAGSGTTQHAVNLLNAFDNGNRKCIMVTNNEIHIEEEKKLTKLGFKKGDKEWESLGIAKYVNWPRTKCSILGIDINGNALKGDYLTLNSNGDALKMSTGFNCNVKYLKCDWVERRPQDFLLSNALSLHVKEMIELQNFISIDNHKYLLILNKTDFKNNFINNSSKNEIKNIWINQNIVLDSNEIKELKKYKFKYIPKEFFGHELKEVAE